MKKKKENNNKEIEFKKKISVIFETSTKKN